jgi:hypothetical protein
MEENGHLDGYNLDNWAFLVGLIITRTNTNAERLFCQLILGVIDCWSLRMANTAVSGQIKCSLRSFTSQ